MSPATIFPHPRQELMIGPLVSPDIPRGAHSASGPALIVTVGQRTCAVPLQHVVETMRPLAISPVAGAPDFIRGLAVIRGAPVPVVDLQALLDGRTTGATYRRFVTVRAGERRVAIGVDGVIGVRSLDAAHLAALPSLLDGVAAGPIEAIGTRDAQLLVVLRATHLIPDDAWATLEGPRGAR